MYIYMSVCVCLCVLGTLYETGLRYFVKAADRNKRRIKYHRYFVFYHSAYRYLLGIIFNSKIQFQLSPKRLKYIQPRYNDSPPCIF